MQVFSGAKKEVYFGSFDLFRRRNMYSVRGRNMDSVANIYTPSIPRDGWSHPRSARPGCSDIWMYLILLSTSAESLSLGRLVD